VEKTTKMVEEITIKRKMTEDVKAKLKKRILHNWIFAIIMLVCISVINVSYIVAKQEVIITLIKVFSMILIFFTIVIFELAYRKDSGKMAIVGIEFLVYSIMILYVSFFYRNMQKTISLPYFYIPLICIIYYIGKTIILYKRTQNEYQNNLSDVKEIVKE